MSEQKTVVIFFDANEKDLNHDYGLRGRISRTDKLFVSCFASVHNCFFKVIHQSDLDNGTLSIITHRWIPTLLLMALLPQAVSMNKRAQLHGNSTYKHRECTVGSASFLFCFYQLHRYIYIYFLLFFGCWLPVLNLVKEPNQIMQ